ncbi:MAG: glucan-binding protein [bacterium]|nr:glucan-binding protein [bacterium]
MRKQTKLVAVLSATALLAIGASMTSFAVTGWVNENGTFYYYDSDGDMVTNEWKKDGNSYFYLGDDGAMVTSSWVEDDYYVGPNGAMVTNAWVKTLADDSDDTDPEDDGEGWYYFNNKGKKVTGDEKKINGKYYRFDDDGKMVDGWYEDGEDVYYYGDEDDGARKTGWLYLEADTDDDGVDVDIDDDDNYDTEAWYYFDSKGVRVEGNKKKINGKWYAFNDHGQMQYGWVIKDGWSKDNGQATSSDASIDDLWYMFGEDNGARVNGFIKIDGSEYLGQDSNNNWYYFDDGEAEHATASDSVAIPLQGSTDSTFTRRIAKIKLEGKYFAFDQNGKMKTGIQAIRDDNADGGYEVYYFDSDGYMKTGKINSVEEDDDDTYTYYFNTNNGGQGKGWTGEKDGYLYYKGKRQEADDDYVIVSVKGNNYLVNEKGKIQKSSTKYYTDIENEGFAGTYVRVNSNGIVTGVYDDDKNSIVTSGTSVEDYLGTVETQIPYFEP